MKARPYKKTEKGMIECPLDEVTHIVLNIPGNRGCLLLPVILKGKRDGTNCWTWNGDTEKPTLKPSVLTTGNNFRSHSFISEGQVQFLSDCSHEFANKTMDLLEV